MDLLRIQSVLVPTESAGDQIQCIHDDADSNASGNETNHSSMPDQPVPDPVPLLVEPSQKGDHLVMKNNFEVEESYLENYVYYDIHAGKEVYCGSIFGDNGLLPENGKKTEEECTEESEIRTSINEKKASNNWKLEISLRSNSLDLDKECSDTLDRSEIVHFVSILMDHTASWTYALKFVNYQSYNNITFLSIPSHKRSITLKSSLDVSLPLSFSLFSGE